MISVVAIMLYHIRSLAKKGLPVVICQTRFPVSQGKFTRRLQSMSMVPNGRSGQAEEEKPEEEYNGSFNEGIA